jgi:DNA invertase Pin-like site-specific DNA recombinase
MKAAVYARYSSENQRPESITDQVSACRRFAAQHGHTVLDPHIYADEALSGARKDRPSLKALVGAASSGDFEMVLVDDLSRLARDNYLMLTLMEELEYEGVRVVSVADGIDSSDGEATLGIQMRGIFNQLALDDLKKKTLRGQIGQLERGYFVGGRTFGYRSVAHGEVRLDKKGRERPEGYKMEINPSQAAVVLRVFKEFADGKSQTAIVKTLNDEGVSGPFKSGKKWSPSTLHRMLTNEKYIGTWIWNRTENRRDPRTGRKRQHQKPKTEWIVKQHDDLQIIPGDLWKTVQARKDETRETWPGGKGKRGFVGQKASKEKHYPTHLLAGSMTCGSCGGTIGLVSGKGDGYYGCTRASKKA